jgi:hypothetical protein
MTSLETWFLSKPENTSAMLYGGLETWFLSKPEDTLRWRYVAALLKIRFAGNIVDTRNYEEKE